MIVGEEWPRSSATTFMALQSLARAEHLAERLRLEALDEACTRAVGGSVMDAKDFVDQVVLGTLG